MKFNVDMWAYANATITVELSDERLAQIAADLEKAVGQRFVIQNR